MTARIIGYARVSTEDQNLDLQRLALEREGTARLFEDRVSGATVKRPGLDAALAALEPGDTLAVWRLDRLGRSLPHLIEVIRGLEERGCHFRSVTEAIDTSTAGGRLVFHLMGALAEFERALIQERTRAGMGAARARGVHVGRPVAVSPTKLAQARKLVEAGESPAAVAGSLGVGRSTLYRALKESPAP